MSEGIEMPEAHHGQEELPYTIPVAVTMSILAVLVAIASLFGHRAATELIKVQNESKDQWSYYQAKNARLYMAQVGSDAFAALTAKDQQKADKAHDKYAKDVERYSDEKGDISDKAKEYEADMQLVERKVDRFDASEVILQIGLIICSLTLLTRKKLFWYAGIGLGAVGFIAMLTGFFMRG
jgi:ABC-type nickel/cobalt efflux system permease component RcnA